MASIVVRELGVLGPTAVRVDGVVVALRPRERDVLAALALTHPRKAAVPDIAQILWPVAEPASAKVTIQNHVARLRRRLGNDAIVTDGGAYRLGPTWSLDVEEFDARVERGRRRAIAGDHAAARVELEQARALVRGDPFADLDDAPPVLAARLHRRELAAAADEELLLALLAGGEHAAAIAMATALVAADPDREQRWTAVALALYRGGQRRESVQVLARGRHALREVAGLEAGPTLAHLESLILADDPSLLSAAPASLTGHATSPEPGRTPREVFVGRAAELDAVRLRLLARFDERSAGCIAITGPPGIGKSAFSERVAVQAAIDGWHVVSVTCRPTPTRPLEPLGELVRQIVDKEPNPADALVPGLLTDLATLWSSAADPPRGDLGEAVIDVVTTHAERFPTLLVIDDAHHVPATAGALLRRLTTVAAPVITLLAHATDVRTPAVPDGAATVELEGLDVTDAGRLLELLTGASVAPGLARSMVRATGGSPERLRHAARHADGLDPEQPSAGDALGALLLDALVQAGPAAEAIAHVLALAGAPLPSAVVQAAVVVPFDASSLANAIARGIEVGALVERPDDHLDLIDDRLGEALLARPRPRGTGRRARTPRRRPGASRKPVGRRPPPARRGRARPQARHRHR